MPGRSNIHVGDLCHTDRQPKGAAILTPALRRNQSTGVDRHLHFLSKFGSIDSLTMKDQIDVGISPPLQSGLGLFDPLHVASPGSALRLTCLGTAKADDTDGYSMFRVYHRTG